MVIEYTSPPSLLEELHRSVKSSSLCSLTEVMRNLKSNLGEHLWRLLLLGGHFIEEVLGLSKHEAAEHSQGLCLEVSGCLIGLQLSDVLLEVFKNPGGLLKIFTRVLDPISVKRHIAGHASQADTDVELGAEGVHDRGVALNAALSKRIVPHELHVNLSVAGAESEVLVHKHGVLVILLKHSLELLELLDFVLESLHSGALLLGLVEVVVGG